MIWITVHCVLPGLGQKKATSAPICPAPDAARHVAQGHYLDCEISGSDIQNQLMNVELRTLGPNFYFGNVLLEQVLDYISNTSNMEFQVQEYKIVQIFTNE